MGLWDLVEPNDSDRGDETRTDTPRAAAASAPVGYGRAKKEIQIDGHGASCRMSEQSAGSFLLIGWLVFLQLSGPVAVHIWPEK